MITVGGFITSVAFAIVMSNPSQAPQDETATPVPEPPSAAQPSAPAVPPIEPPPVAPPPVVATPPVVPAPSEEAPVVVAPDQPLAAPAAVPPNQPAANSAEVDRLAAATIIVPESGQTKIIGPTITLSHLGYFLSGTKSAESERMDLFIAAGFEDELNLLTIHGNGWPLDFKAMKSGEFCASPTACTYYQDIEIALPVAALQRFAPTEGLELSLEGTDAKNGLTISPSYLQAFLQRFNQAELPPTN